MKHIDSILVPIVLISVDFCSVGALLWSVLIETGEWMQSGCGPAQIHTYIYMIVHTCNQDTVLQSGF